VVEAQFSYPDHVATAAITQYVEAGWAGASLGKKTSSQKPKPGFRVKPESEQTHPNGAVFPPEAPGEGPRKYFARPDFLEALRQAKGLEAEANLFDLTPTEVRAVMEVQFAYPAHMTAAAIRQYVEAGWAGASLGKKTTSQKPKTDLEARFPDSQTLPTQSWPNSAAMREELPRLELLQLAVALEWISILQKAPEDLAYFIGRDSDDFWLRLGRWHPY
jgi:hypothetical protein